VGSAADPEKAEGRRMTPVPFAFILGIATDLGSKMSNQPDAVLVDFLKSLPVSIRTEILIFVRCYGFGEKFDADFVKLETNEFLPVIIGRIANESDPFGKISVIIRVMAALDFSHWSSMAKFDPAESFLHYAKAEQLPQADQMLAGLPLRRKHTEHALARWSKIRETQLTHQTLMDYQSSLLRG
jgi:hypothetical protein